jgi:molybdate transport system regulatory protein
MSLTTGTELSTRNQLRGTVQGVVLGSVMAEVSVDVHGEQLVAAITRHSAERLNLREGDTVTVLVKATEVMLAKGSSPIDSLTTRNQLAGKVVGVQTGSVMAEVAIGVGGDELIAAVTRHSVERLGLAEGDDVIVLIKATEVMLAK